MRLCQPGIRHVMICVNQFDLNSQHFWRDCGGINRFDFHPSGSRRPVKDPLLFFKTAIQLNPGLYSKMPGILKSIPLQMSSDITSVWQFMIWCIEIGMNDIPKYIEWSSFNNTQSNYIEVIEVFLFLRRLFGPKCCSRCSKSISGEELVMKTGLDVFHVNCFACSMCDRQLTTGQHYGIYDRLIYCQPHYEEILTTNQSQKPHFDGTSQTPADLKENSRGGGGGGNLSPFASAVSTADANSSPPYIPRQPIACGFNGSNTSGKIRSRKRKVCLPDSIPNPFGQTKFSMSKFTEILWRIFVWIR